MWLKMAREYAGTRTLADTGWMGYLCGSLVRLAHLLLSKRQRLGRPFAPLADIDGVVVGRKARQYNFEIVSLAQRARRRVKALRLKLRGIVAPPSCDSRTLQAAQSMMGD